jgi:chlorite dismutase
MSIPSVKLSRGIHVVHLFYTVDRVRWTELGAAESQKAQAALTALLAKYNAPSNPRIRSYANVGGRADFAFIIYAAELGLAGEMHRELEACFAPGALKLTYRYLSVTELPEYVTTEEDMKNQLVQREKLEPGSELYAKRLKEMLDRQAMYERYRLYPEMEDWEIMCFYGMSKRRLGADNWYMLDLPTRKKLMASHAVTGRKFAGRVSQLITGSTGLDDYEWGVTLIAHQTDAIKEIIYEMRFDEVSARYGDFGPFYINLRLDPADLWSHLRL